MSWQLALSSALGVGTLVISYASVLFDSFGRFPLPGQETSYLDSAYWVGMPRPVIIATVFFQILAAMGYLIWVVWMSTMPPAGGISSIMASNLLFLVSSALWPLMAHRMLRQPEKTIGWALAASTCLWAAAAGVILMLVETRVGNPAPLVGILLLAIVVVLIDGVGWTSVAIFRSLYATSRDGAKPAPTE